MELSVFRLSMYKMQIIMRELNLNADYLKDPANVQAIEEYLNVTISQNESYTLFSVSQIFTEDQIINSYLSTTGEVTLPEEEQGDIINYLPITDISEPEEMVINTTTSLMDIYTVEHELDAIDYTGDVGDLVDALKQIDDPLSFDVMYSFKEYQDGGTITGSHLIFNGTLVLKEGETLVVEDGYILFIFGNFIMEAGATFKGNMMVTGSVDFKVKRETQTTFEGTLYTDGNIDIRNDLLLGSAERPTFMFSKGDIQAYKSLNGYGYFISDTFVANSGTIYGDVIANYILLNGLSIEAFNLMTIYDKFFDYALPLSLQGGSSGDFVYTNPKIN